MTDLTRISKIRNLTSVLSDGMMGFNGYQALPDIARYNLETQQKCGNHQRKHCQILPDKSNARCKILSYKSHNYVQRALKKTKSDAL